MTAALPADAARLPRPGRSRGGRPAREVGRRRRGRPRPRPGRRTWRDCSRPCSRELAAPGARRRRAERLVAATPACLDKHSGPVVHHAPPRRVRPADGAGDQGRPGRPARAGGRLRPRTRRRRRPQGGRARSSPTAGASTSTRRATPAWRPAARATCCRGSSPRCSARGWSRSTRPCSASTLHGLAGDLARDARRRGVAHRHGPDRPLAGGVPGDGPVSPGTLG